MYTPSRSYLVRSIGSAIGLILLGAAFALSLVPPVDVPPEPTLIAQELLAPAPMPQVAAIETPAAPDRARELQLVFRAGDATYMKLARVGAGGEPMPNHGALRLYDRGEIDGWRASSVAVVADRDLSPAHREWRRRHVIVDGTCEATVTGFAVVARLTGDPGYAPGDATAWTAANVFDLAPTVLAAKLEGCEDGTFARDAALSPVVVPEVTKDAALVKQARARLLASEPSRRGQREWLANDRDGTWHESGVATVSALVVRHPITHVTWVSVHARIEEGCGAPEINIWGLYRVDRDELVTVQQRDLGELWAIDQLIDIDRDGELELVGKPWLGTDTIVTRASGDEVTRLDLPFFGCPC